MSYPRHCPLCRTSYGELGKHATRQATLRSEPGGTPSRWHPDQPGRLLLLLCHECLGRYTWDYFGEHDVEPGEVRPEPEIAAPAPAGPWSSPARPGGMDALRLSRMAGGERGDARGGR
jgi:hypothetical protein